MIPDSPSRPLIVVLAAVIERDDCFLVTRRVEGTHLAGFWEFPGGKCEPGETHEGCLVREISEELGVTAVVGPEILTTEHVYPERTVRLHFRACSIAGEPEPLIGQEVRWVRRSELTTLAFPPADDELIKKLTDKN